MVILGLFAILLGFGLSYPLTSLSAHPGSFAWEYGFIAENLAEGRGYSGPFGPSSDPTAWMPPLLPVLMAFVFLIFGVKSLSSAVVLLCLQAFWVWSGLWCLLKLELGQKEKILLSGLYALYAYLNWGSLLYEFHDVGLMLTLSTLALLSLERLRQSKPSLAYLSAILLPLSSPALTLPFVLLLLFGSCPRRHAIRTLMVMVFVGGIWTSHRAITLGAFIPIKSNAYFELYQANAIDPDGVLQPSTFVLFHPVVGYDEEKKEYEQKGEINYLAPYKEKSLEFVRKHPLVFLKKVGNRFYNAFIFLKAPSDLVWDYDYWDQDLMKELVARRLIGPTCPPLVWCSLRLTTAAFELKLDGLTKAQRERVIDGRELALHKLKVRNHTWQLTVWGFLHALIPALAMIAGWSQKRLRERSVFRDAVILYITYLAPYVVISHYVRYQVPLMGLSVIILSSLLVGRDGEASHQSFP